MKLIIYTIAAVWVLRYYVYTATAAFERMMHYSRLQPEPDIPSGTTVDSDGDNSDWPRTGALQVEELTVRYFIVYTV
jgi:hypothetical protein